MDEYGELVIPQNSVYRDILSLIQEHSSTLEGENRDMLQELIKTERELVDTTVRGSLLLIKAELKEIESKYNVKSSGITVIK